jgi:hypothetical protein
VRGAVRGSDLKTSAAVPAATVAPGEHVLVVAATDRVAGTLRAVLSTLVQVVERVAPRLAAGTQGGDTSHIEERARVVRCEGSVEVSHVPEGSRALGGSRIFGCPGEPGTHDALGDRNRRTRARPAPCCHRATRRALAVSFASESQVCVVNDLTAKGQKTALRARV